MDSRTTESFKQEVYLNIKNVYDTLTREGKPDSLVLSSDEKSNGIKLDEFVIEQISGGDKADGLIE